MTSLPKDPQASTNEPCRAWFTDFSSLYTASGFYNNSTNCTDTAAPFSCSISRNGYLYTRSSTLHYAVLGIRLEPDGTTNSYGGIGAYTGAQIACNWAETNN